MTEPPRGAAERVAYLIRLVAAGPHRFSLGELAARAELPPSTVHRLLKVLLDCGFVERGSGQSYRPGRELYRTASQLIARFDLTRSARPFLEMLVAEWQETAVLCAYSPPGRCGMIADVVSTPHLLRFAVEKGGEVALPWGSLGRAILAFLPTGEGEILLREAGDGPLTGRPRPTRAELEADLARIRKEGTARHFDPRHDLAGIAAPIFGAEKEMLGCIGVTMPSARYRLHEEDDLAAAVRAAAIRISELAAISYS